MNRQVTNMARTIITLEARVRELEKALWDMREIARLALAHEEAEVVRRCRSCGRDLHGYRGPRCRYCRGTAEA